MKRKMFKLLVIAVIALVFVIGATQRFDRIVVSEVIVTGSSGITVSDGDLFIGDGTPDVTVDGNDVYIGGTQEVDGAARFDGAIDANSTMNLAGNLTLGDEVILTPQTTISVTFGTPITATGFYQPIQSADFGSGDGQAVTDIAAGASTGQLLLVHNLNASQAITIDGTGATVECKADVVLAAQDTLTLLFNGTNWICISGYDNS